MAERIPGQLKEEIVAANDIVDIVSKYVSLKRTGTSMVGLCPFHKEKTPSFHVTPDRQLFHCFGCNASGDVIEFVRMAENLDFVDTVKFLAERANISLDFNKFSKEDSILYKQKQTILEVNKEAARFFRDTLVSPKGAEMLKYILGRGLNKESVKAYGIGCAPDGWDSLFGHLTEKGFDRGDILNSGVSVYSDKGRIYDRFRDRLMFPIIDIRGNVIGFGGRYIDDRKPKYLNSPETPVFNKRQNLFSLNIAKNFAEGELVLVEGYMDVISLYQNNIKNVVASLGTAFTPEQARLASRYARSIVICYDTDEAGIKAANHAIDIFKGLDVKVKILSLPSGKDPDDYVMKNGGERFKALVSNAESVAGYRISLLKKKYDISNTEQKVEFLSECANILSRVNSDIERDAYISKIANETGVSQTAINTEVSKLYRKIRTKERYNIQKGRNKSVLPQKSLGADTILKGSSALVKAEQLLLSLCVFDTNVCKKYTEINSDLFSLPVHQRIIGYLIGSDGVEASALISKFSEDDALEASAALSMPLNFENNLNAAAELIETIKKERLEYLIKKAAGEGNVSELSHLIAEKNKREEGLISG
jgi:DNA primase